jgi:ABC-2 type transport system permease protein
MNLIRAMIGLNIKTALAMRAAFLMRFSFAIANHAILLVTWLFLFRAVPVVHGWNVWHLLMAYGLAWFAWGFVSFFTYGYKVLPRTIEFGELDHFLLQPRPLLLMLAANNGEVFGLPDMFLAGILIILAGIKIHAAWLLVIFAIACSSVVFAAFTLLIGSLAFWLNDMHDWLLDTQYNLYIFATRPASAFGGWVKLLMFSLLPMGFISYLPVEIIRLSDPRLIGGQLLGSFIIVAISLGVFRLGLKNYESGNRFGVRV